MAAPSWHAPQRRVLRNWNRCTLFSWKTVLLVTSTLAFVCTTHFTAVSVLFLVFLYKNNFTQHAHTCGMLNLYFYFTLFNFFINICTNSSSVVYTISKILYTNTK